MNIKEIKIGMEVAVPVNEGSWQYRVGRVARFSNYSVKLVNCVTEWPAINCQPVPPLPSEETLQALGIEELGPLVDIRRISPKVKWISIVGTIKEGADSGFEHHLILRWSIARIHEPEPKYGLGDWFVNTANDVCFLTFTTEHTINLMYPVSGRRWNDGARHATHKFSLTLPELRTLLRVPGLRPATKAEVQEAFARILHDKFGDEE